MANMAGKKGRLHSNDRWLELFNLNLHAQGAPIILVAGNDSSHCIGSTDPRWLLEGECE